MRQFYLRKSIFAQYSITLAFQKRFICLFLLVLLDLIHFSDLAYNFIRLFQERQHKTTEIS